MNGPCTLLAQPHLERYIDALGTHDMPWHEKPFVKRRVTHATGSVSINYPAEFWAYFARTNLEAVPVELVDAVTVFSPGNQAKWSATNGSKSTVFITNLVSFLASNWVDFDAQQFWEVLGSSYAHGTGHLGTSWVTKVVSTGGDVTITTPANDNLSTHGTFAYAAAIVVNASASDRTVKLIANGVDAFFTSPGVVPAKSYASIRGATGGFAVGDALGVKFPGTNPGDEFYVIQYGLTPAYTGDPFGPFVHTTSSDIPDTLFFDPNALGPVDVFSGVNFESQGRSGETFWRVPLTTAHIPDDQRFTVVSRNHPMYLPFVDVQAYYWAITRMAETYTAAAGGISIGLGQSAVNAGDASQGSRVTLRLANNDASVSGSQVLSGMANPLRQIAPFLSAVVVDVDRTQVRQGAVIGAPVPMAGNTYPGWMEIGSEALSDLLLIPGATPDAGRGSFGMSREHAIFSRPLTDAEWAYLNDPASVWSFNMFSPPTKATVSGLDAPLYRGDDRQVTITVMDADGDAVPLYGCSVWFTGKKRLTSWEPDTDAPARCSAAIGPDGSVTAGEGVASVDPANGIITFTFAVPDVHVLNYDVQVEDVNGDVRTVALGKVNISPDVTRRTTTP